MKPLPLPRFIGRQDRLYPSFRSLLGALHSTGEIPKVLPSKTELVQGMATIDRGIHSESFCVRASLLSFRKLFSTDTSPVAKAESARAFMADLERLRLPDPDGIDAMTQCIKHLFPSGWDARYDHFCDLARLGKKSSYHDGKTSSTRQFAQDEELTEEAFLQAVLDGKASFIPPERNIQVLDDGGKLRLITVASYMQAQLLPLHLTLYDHLVRTGLVLRGDITCERLGKTGMRFERGKVFVSGDYEGATNKFNPTHSRHALRELRRRSSSVPQEIWDVALDSLYGTLRYQEKGQADLTSAQTSGQMMGNYLSFPLLCLTNLSTLFAAFPEEASDMCRRKLVLVNGDDIVFQTTREGYEVWAESVTKSGLVLSKEKTMVHPRFLSLNSTYFRMTTRKKGTGICQLPVVRATALYGPPFIPKKGKDQWRVAAGAGVFSRLESLLKPFPHGNRRRIIIEHYNHINEPATHFIGFATPRELSPCDIKLLSLPLRTALHSFRATPSLYRCRVPPPPGFTTINTPSSTVHPKRHTNGKLIVERIKFTDQRRPQPSEATALLRDLARSQGRSATWFDRDDYLIRPLHFPYAAPSPLRGCPPVPFSYASARHSNSQAHVDVYNIRHMRQIREKEGLSLPRYVRFTDRISPRADAVCVSSLGFRILQSSANNRLTRANADTPLPPDSSLPSYPTFLPLTDLSGKYELRGSGLVDPP